MLHPAGSIYGFLFIRDKLKFKTHEAQTQITPLASLLKISLIVSLSFSPTVKSVSTY